MNNPKIYLTILILAGLLLAGFVTLSPQPSKQTITAKVISQTLTQSLDGHRRFVNIETEHGDSELISIPPQVDCPAGATLSLSLTKTWLQSKVQYQYIDCYKAVTSELNQ